MLLFQKLITETQISKPPEPTMDHNSIISSHCDAIILGPGYESMMVSVYFGFVIYVGRGGI